MKYKGFGSLKVLGIMVLPFYLFTFLLFIACTLSGCVEEYEADISAEDTDLLVVEGTICSGKSNTFFLSRTQTIKTDDSPKRVTGAIVSVRGTDGSEYMAQETYESYSCKLGTLEPDVDYYLHIECDGEIYESTPQRPLRTEKIADVRGVENTSENTIDVFMTPDDPFDPNQANYYSWTYDETWEVRPEYKTSVYYDVDLRMPVEKLNQFPERGWRNSTNPTIMVGTSNSYEGQHIRNMKLYDISLDDSRISYRYSGLLHQRAISKAEYEYELARRQVSSEMGGLFTPLPSALPTNIHCLTSRKHVIGFVGCSLNTGEYRFFLDAADFSIRRSSTDTRVWLDEPTEEECLQMVRRGLYLCEWQTPERSLDGKVHAIWATLKQLDVRARFPDVYISEPYFWSWKENVSF